MVTAAPARLKNRRALSRVGVWANGAQDPVGRKSRRGETDATSLAGSRRI